MIGLIKIEDNTFKILENIFDNHNIIIIKPINSEGHNFIKNLYDKTYEVIDFPYVTKRDLTYDVIGLFLNGFKVNFYALQITELMYEDNGSLSDFKLNNISSASFHYRFQLKEYIGLENIINNVEDQYKNLFKSYDVINKFNL